jgi:CBS domain-containing protein
MITKQKPLTALTAGEVMSAPVQVVSQSMSLRDAARLLRQADVSGAPVVDEDGKCVGILSSIDFRRWAEDGRDLDEGKPGIRNCPYQKDGLRAGGTKGVLCTLAEGKCPLQSPHSTLPGERALFCQLPRCVLLDWQVVEEPAINQVRNHMTTDVVSIRSWTPLTTVARIMLDAHIHRVVVVDEAHHPVGIVTSTDILARVAMLASDRGQRRETDN